MLILFHIKGYGEVCLESPITKPFGGHEAHEWFCFKCGALQAWRKPMGVEIDWYFHDSIICPECNRRLQWPVFKGLEMLLQAEQLAKWEPLVLLRRQFLFNTEIYS